VAWLEAGVTGVMSASHFAEGGYLTYFGAYAFAGEIYPENLVLLQSKPCYLNPYTMHN